MKHVVKRSLSLLLVLLLCLQLIPLTGGHVHAEDAEELEHSEEYYELRECPFCGKIREVGDTICVYCHACCDDNGCYYDSASHCKACDRCAANGVWICLECSLCEDCVSYDNHCVYCLALDPDSCADCKAQGIKNLCMDCHDAGFDGKWAGHSLNCSGCDTCLYALTLAGEWVCDHGNGEAHCAKCDEDWICNECGGCFYGLDFDFCATCQ
ncbi:MAG: hypothetical protein MJ075_06500, partial [Oscillospiraceae bacterium]|nr:hypothetical protein [Oscillospiraceae bacterium]